ncbi:MAG: glycosyltransferase [Actinobacteria bacterium]|nr:glycosyltransferase [Actinomycetota bacterium]
MEPLTVVLVHWGQPERCLASVEAFCAQGLAVRMVVVDNGSSPEHLDRLRAGLPDTAELLEAHANLGFGPGANVGLRHWLAVHEGEWVAVAPHDALPDPGCLRRVMDAVRARPRAGLASADVGDGRVPVVDPYFGGITLPPDPSVGAADGWEACGYPHGTLMFARRSCLEAIGLFDERYFAYCEEADLGERARRAGWEVGLVRGARVRNPNLGGRSDVVDYLMLRNTLLLVRDHFGAYKAGVRTAIALIHLAKGLAVPSARPWIFAPAARVRALADHAQGRYGPPPESLATRPVAPR